MSNYSSRMRSVWAAMPAGSKITIFVAGVWFVVFLMFAARASTLKQLLLMLITLGFLGFGITSFVRLLTHWRREGWALLIPMAVCGIILIFAPVGSAVVRSLIFQWQLPRYEAVIRQIDSGTIPVSAELGGIPTSDEVDAYAILAQRSTNGVLNVEFLSGAGFPVKHSGYLYCSSDRIEPESDADRRWPKRHKVRPLWFRISD